MQIDESTVCLVKTLLDEPKIGLFYINEHVIALDAQIMQSQESLSKGQRQLNAALRDI